MENFKKEFKPINVVTFDGLSIPQEDVHKNSFLSYKQSLSNSKFHSSYENEFNKFLNANKKSDMKRQSENWVGHEIEQTLSYIQKFKENSDTGISVSNCTSFNKTVCFKRSRADLEKFGSPMPDHSGQWKTIGEDTHKSLSECQSHLSQMNGTNVTEDAYLCKVDTTKFVLTDIDYLRAKCRWNYNNVSDYAENPKIIERIRYLEMFTQCFAVRNDENEYNFGNADRISVENDNSCFGDRDDFDVYKDKKCVTYDKKVIDDFVNIPERENSSCAVQKDNNLHFGSIFRPNVYTVSVPNVKQPSGFSYLCETKRFVDPTINAELDRNNSKFKTLLSRARSSRKSLKNTNCDKTDENVSLYNYSTGNKKLKGCYTTTCNIDKNQSRDYSKQNFKCFRYDRTDIDCKEKDFKENKSDIKHVSTKSKPQISKRCSFKDEETQYQNSECEPNDNLEKKNYNQNNSGGFVHSIIDGCKTSRDCRCENYHTNSETVCNENVKPEKNSVRSKSSLITELESRDETHAQSESSSGTCYENVSCNSMTRISEKGDGKIKKDFIPVVKKSSKPFYVRLFGGDSDKNEYLSLCNTKHFKVDDYDHVMKEKSQENSELSESNLSSRCSESVEGSELFNKYFLNEFIMGVLRPEVKEKGGIPSDKHTTACSTNRKLIISNRSESDDDNENNKVTMSLQECQNECDVGDNSLNKKCTHISCNKEKKPIIVIEFNCEKNSKIENIPNQVGKMDDTHGHQFVEVLKSDRYAEHNKNGMKRFSGNSLDVNSSNSNSKLTTILEGSDSCSENSKPCEISFKIFGTTDSTAEISKDKGTNQYFSTIKHPKMPTPIESDAESEVSDNNYLIRKTSASSVNLSSESSLSKIQVKTRKSRKPKKRKMKKRMCGDYRKTNDNLAKTSRMEKRKISNHQNGGQNSHNKNAGPNVYLSCWKRYCVIL